MAAKVSHARERWLQTVKELTCVPVRGAKAASRRLRSSRLNSSSRASCSAVGGCELFFLPPSLSFSDAQSPPLSFPFLPAVSLSLCLSLPLPFPALFDLLAADRAFLRGTSSSNSSEISMRRLFLLAEAVPLLDVEPLASGPEAIALLFGAGTAPSSTRALGGRTLGFLAPLSRYL